MTISAAKAGSLTSLDSWFRFWMPYCFVKLDHPKRKHVLLPLNRIYKPLGIIAKDHLNYEAFTDQAMAFSSDPAGFKDVWHRVDGDHFWLYNDGAASRFDYFERLALLTVQPHTLVAKINTPEIAR